MLFNIIHRFLRRKKWKVFIVLKYKEVDIHTYIYTHTHTYIHILIYTYVHTHKLLNQCKSHFLHIFSPLSLFSFKSLSSLQFIFFNYHIIFKTHTHTHIHKHFPFSPLFSSLSPSLFCKRKRKKMEMKSVIENIYIYICIYIARLKNNIILEKN